MQHQKRRKQPPLASRPSKSTYYPTIWSAWEWDIASRCFQSYRLKGPDDYEYDSQPGPTKEQAQANMRASRLSSSLPRKLHNKITSSDTKPSRSSFPLNYYPTQWSEWAWVSTHGRNSRYRLKGPNVYEYEYQEVPPQPQPQSKDLRIPQLSFASIELPDSNGPYPPTEYDRAAADELAAGLSGVSIDGLHITTDDPKTFEEALDLHYKVHHAREFKFGKVFKVFWAEPNGGGKSNGGDNISDSGTTTEKQDKYGEVVHQKVRRFVIMQVMAGHCICLAINSYGKKGVMKHGVHASHHTIIHTEKRPVFIKGEKAKGMTKTPIVMVPHNARHKLIDTSRLNYAKPYTVECNVKVWFVGKIHVDSEWQLDTDYNLMHPPVKPRGKPPAPGNIHQYAEGSSNAFYPTPQYALSSATSMSKHYSQHDQSWTTCGKTSSDEPTRSGNGEAWPGSQKQPGFSYPEASGAHGVHTQSSNFKEQDLAMPEPHYTDDLSFSSAAGRSSGQVPSIPRADEPTQLEQVEEESIDLMRPGSGKLAQTSASRSTHTFILSGHSDTYYKSNYQEDLYGASKNEA